MTTDSLKSAKDYFYKNDYNKALELFTEAKYNYGAGLCCLLLKDKKQARALWKKNAKNCPGCAFGLTVLNLIELDTKKLPTFFQLRAFLEVYINLFLQNDYLEWAENLISCCDSLFTKNPECYKFIARALYSNGYFDLAITFCKRSLQFFYSDPEALLIMSQCQFLLGNLGEALDCVNKILYMTEYYFPAKVFRKVIQAKIEEKHQKAQ